MIEIGHLITKLCIIRQHDESMSESLRNKKLLLILCRKYNAEPLSKCFRALTHINRYIEDLAIPYCAVATDLYTGDEVVFREGSLFKAIRASISIPGLLRPVRYGLRTMVDGGLVNSIPLNRVQRRRGDILIGFNVNDIDKEKIRERLEQTEALRERRAGRRGAISEAIDTVRHTDGNFLDKIKVAGQEGSEMLEEIRRDRDYEELDLGGNYYSLLDRTFDLMNHRNTILSIAATPPDVLVNMPFDAYGAIADYAKVREISDLGRSLMAKALDEYEAR